MLNKNSPLPLYHQLKTFIEEQIETGEWLPGMRMPSERELCLKFQVSRITVRQAISELVVEGRLLRQQGLGTFVASPRIEQLVNRLTSFTQDIRSQGKIPGSRVLQLERIPASTTVTRALNLGPGEPVVLLKRLRLSDGEPLAIEIAHLPANLYQGLLEDMGEDHSLYELLAQKFNIYPSRAEQKLEAMACPAAEARLLKIRKDSPVLHIYRVAYDGAGQPFEYTESFYRGDRYVFQFELAAEMPPLGLARNSDG